MKKIISLILVIIMCMSSINLSLAANLEDSIKAKNVKNILNTCKISNSSEAMDDIAFLNNQHISSEYLTNVTESSNKELSYCYQLTDDILAEITIANKPDGKFLTIKEGDLLNTLEIKDNGNYILNGNLVVVQQEERKYPMANEDQVMPRVFTDMYYVEKCPYGVASDYGKYYDYSAKATLLFDTFFVNITLTAFTAIIGNFINAYLGLGVSFAAVLLGRFKEYDPYSKAASYEEWSYIHSKKGFYVQLEMGVVKYDINVWSRENFEGTMTKQTAYKVWEMENGEG